MPHGAACPPGTDLEYEECNLAQREVPSWQYWRPQDMYGYLPKCFLYNGNTVFFNIGQNSNVPPSKEYSKHQAICKKTPKQKPPGEFSFSYLRKMEKFILFRCASISSLALTLVSPSSVARPSVRKSFGFPFCQRLRALTKRRWWPT